MLSRAVNWDKLEEQLFYAKIGYDERRRKAFQRVMKMDDESICYFANNLAELSPYALSATLLYMNSAADGGDEETEEWNRDTPADLSSSPSSPPSLHHHSTISVKIKTKGIGRKKRKFFPRHETVDIMRSVLDFATHLRNYPVPLAPELAVFVAAKEDLYIPRQHVQDVRSIWPGKVDDLAALTGDTPVGCSDLCSRDRGPSDVSLQGVRYAMSMEVTSVQQFCSRLTSGVYYNIVVLLCSFVLTRPRDTRG